MLKGELLEILNVGLDIEETDPILSKYRKSTNDSSSLSDMEDEEDNVA